MKKGSQKQSTSAPALPLQTKSKENKTPKKKDEIDPEFAEFLEIHSKKQSAKAIWDNDGIDGLAPKSAGESTAPNDVQDDKVAHKKELSDLEVMFSCCYKTMCWTLFFLQYLKAKVVASDGDGQKPSVKPAAPAKKEKIIKEFFTLKARGFACQIKKKDVREFFSPLKPDSIRLPPKVKGVAYIGFASEKEFKKALDKHRSFYGKKLSVFLFSIPVDCQIFYTWTGGHRICVAKYEKKNEISKTSAKKEAWIQQESDMKKEESVAESGRIFIRNLPYSVSEEELEALFKPFGPLAEVHVPIDKHSRKIKVSYLCLKWNE